MSLTRRDLLLGFVAQSVAPRELTPVNFDVPSGACDCHVHIQADPQKFPFSPKRTYTPETALPDALAALHTALHIQRVVIVTPSVYGTDNSATLYGMKARGRDARGVAVIDDETPDSALDEMGKAGVRGIRLNFGTLSINDPAMGRRLFLRAAERVAPRGWHVQINTTPPMITGLKDQVAASPAVVVFDHFGGARAERGVGQPGFGDLVDLVKSGKAYVKISGAYRASSLPDFRDVVPLAKSLISANVDRVLWGSDWPHPDSSPVAGRKPTDLSPNLRIDDGLVLNQLPIWAPDAAIRKKILVDNAARLYGF